MVRAAAGDQDEGMNSHHDSPSSPEDPVTSPDPTTGSAPASGEPAPPSDGSNRPKGSGGFFSWLRSLNVVRGQDRWIGGVATGIAARTGLDPILVRGLFVVLAIFGGIGLLAYGLAWALLPEPDGRIHAESAGRGSWTSGMTGALIVSILGLWRPNVPFFGNTGGFGGFIWSLFWIGVAVFIVYWISNSADRNKSGAGMPTGPAGAVPTGSTGPTSAGPTPAGPPSAAATPGETAPAASGDTVHAVGFVWDKPTTAATHQMPQHFTPQSPASAAKTPPKPTAPRPSGADVAVFLGGAVLLTGLVLALDYLGVLALGDGAMTVALATGVVVLGLGVVLLGIRGRTSGALGFLAAVGIVASLASGAWLATPNWVVASQGQWSIGSADPVEEGYTIVAGQGRVDLTGLSTIREDVVIPVNAAAGNVGILVPDDVRVDVRSMVALSSTELVTALDTTSLGGVWQPGTLHLNEDADGPRIILDIRGVVSHVTVSTTEQALEDTESGQER